LNITEVLEFLNKFEIEAISIDERVKKEFEIEGSRIHRNIFKNGKFDVICVHGEIKLNDKTLTLEEYIFDEKYNKVTINERSFTLENKEDYEKVFNLLKKEVSKFLKTLNP